MLIYIHVFVFMISLELEFSNGFIYVWCWYVAFEITICYFLSDSNLLLHISVWSYEARCLETALNLLLACMKNIQPLLSSFYFFNIYS